jgi:hypothetical protein
MRIYYGRGHYERRFVDQAAREGTPMGLNPSESPANGSQIQDWETSPTGQSGRLFEFAALQPIGLCAKTKKVREHLSEG